MSEIVPSPTQAKFLNELLEHPCAPRYNFQSSDLLDERSLARVKEFEKNVWSQGFWQPDGYPDWLEAFLERICRTVPYYRAQGRPPSVFEAIPTFDRRVLKNEPWSLVPDDLGLDDLTVYTTSGTTGTKVSVPTHPVVSSMLLVLMEKLLSQNLDLSLPRGPGNVAVALVCYQQDTLTYPALSHYLEGAGFVKINLAQDCWHEPKHRGEFLRFCQPAVVTGDPYSFSELAKACPELRPQALISSAVALHPGLKSHLEEVFECPVFDVYSLTEARFIAAAGDDGEHRLLAPDLYVEILGPQDQPLAEGIMGEITLTGGRNPYLPLLRYKTGDRAALRYRGGQPYLENFEGRAAVHLENASGQPLPSLDVVNKLREFPLVGLSLHQDASRAVSFRYAGEVAAKNVEQALRELFETEVSVEQADTWEGKPHRFQSEL